MSKKLTLVTAGLLTLLAAPLNVVYAQALANPSRFESLEEIVNALLSFARPVIVVVLVGTLMYGGWVYMTAQDNDDKIATARRIIVSAVIGFIIIVLAPVILQFVGSLLGVQENLFDV